MAFPFPVRSALQAIAPFSAIVVAMIAAMGAVAGPARAVSPAIGASTDPAPLTLEPCRLEQSARLQSYAAECGRLSVPENRTTPNGRRLELFVARVPAISRSKLPDPLFLIAGGPGQSTAEFYASVATVFARIGRTRDLVLVDQRGTGRSHRLDCASDDSVLLQAGRAALAAAARACRAALEPQADLRQYTTRAAVDDLDSVRRALGYARIDLYGISYGTRVAQQYARRYPAATRALILDGVVAPRTILGPEMAADAQAALDRVLARCRAEPTCRERFSDPAEDFRALQSSLTRQPATLTLADPRTGERRSLEFTVAELDVVLRLASYSADQASVLPLALHLARADGDFTALGATYLLAERAVQGELAAGMQASVICTEDLPFAASARADAAARAASYLGNSQLEALEAVCGEWPRGAVDADFRAPFTSAAPALLLSGSDDPVTPPADAERAARNFPDHRHLILTGLGHGQLTAPCIDRVMAAFLDAGTARGLDTSCTRAVRPMPFFTSLAGPEP